MPEQDRSYFTGSWALLTRDRGWIKPVLVLGVSMLVPIVGMLGVQGYALEWARLTAWGVDASPKQKDVRVGECIASGWRGFLAGAGYGLAGGILIGTLGGLFGDSVIWSALSYLMTILLSMVSALAALRATIYQQPWAGYQLRRMWDMVQRDPGGFAKVSLILLIGSLGISTVLMILSMLSLIPMFMHLFFSLESSGMLYMETLEHADMRVLFYEVADALAAMAPWLTVVGFVGAIGTTMVSLLMYNALALWMRQFDVPNWGASDDPLPESVAWSLPVTGTQPDASAPAYGYVPPMYQPPSMPQQAASVPSDSVESMRDTFEPTESSQVDGVSDDNVDETVVIELTKPRPVAVAAESIAEEPDAEAAAGDSAATAVIDETTAAPAPSEKANAWYEAVAAQQRSEQEGKAKE